MEKKRELYARNDGPDTDPVYRAILHIWRRCIESPEFSWHMLHTESLDRTLLAWDRVRKEDDVTSEQILEALRTSRLPRSNCERDRDEAGAYRDALCDLVEAADGTDISAEALERARDIVDNGPRQRTEDDDA
ncbi:MAG: hypothetical protein KF782_15430 [Labilithrix sp.]|nr:hypothetical protein [Labilithrix sp.]